jgi:hypothetical protein
MTGIIIIVLGFGGERMNRVEVKKTPLKEAKYELIQILSCVILSRKPFTEQRTSNCSNKFPFIPPR